MGSAGSEDGHVDGSGAGSMPAAGPDTTLRPVRTPGSSPEGEMVASTSGAAAPSIKTDLC